MGREAEGEARYRGEAGRVLALLEPQEIILRRGIRARIPRAGITGWRAEGEALHLDTAEGPMTLALGAREAAAWAKALARPLPTLAGKLGLGPGTRVFATGDLSDGALAAALAEARAATADAASLLLAVILDEVQLAAACDLARSRPDLPLWCVYRRGKAVPGDAAVRAAFRGMGWIDSRSCAVSDGLTATRYVRRRG